jgi:hypothetical protein
LPIVEEEHSKKLHDDLWKTILLWIQWKTDFAVLEKSATPAPTRRITVCVTSSRQNPING